MTNASIFASASRTYRGATIDPDRWSTWAPRKGDVFVCTPSKSGTTWTRTILAMLVQGGPELPERISILSPWADADGGLPARDVTVIAVYRHPLDVFFSLRKHVENRKTRGTTTRWAGRYGVRYAPFSRGRLTSMISTGTRSRH